MFKSFFISDLIDPQTRDSRQCERILKGSEQFSCQNGNAIIAVVVTIVTCADHIMPYVI